MIEVSSLLISGNLQCLRHPHNRRGVFGSCTQSKLLSSSEDLWGDEVNQAFKLGDDTAQAGEIMRTSAAHDALTGDRSAFERLEVRLSGVVIDAYITRP